MNGGQSASSTLIKKGVDMANDEGDDDNEDETLITRVLWMKQMRAHPPLASLASPLLYYECKRSLSLIYRIPDTEETWEG